MYDQIASGQANGNGSSITWTGGNTGKGSIIVSSASWDGATATLQVSPDGGTTWVAVGTDSTFTTDGAANFSLPACSVRLVVSGGGGSEAIDAFLTKF